MAAVRILVAVLAALFFVQFVGIECAVRRSATGSEEPLAALAQSLSDAANAIRQQMESAMNSSAGSQLLTQFSEQLRVQHERLAALATNVSQHLTAPSSSS